MNQVKISACGWHGTIAQFLTSSKVLWLTSLDDHHSLCMNMPPDKAQILAWENCFEVLQLQLRKLISQRRDASAWSVIFEYELPRERGRRPDVVILANEIILVLEFKDFREALQAHIDQVAAYARDLQNYHACSHDRKLYPLLVLTRSTSPTTQSDSVFIASPTNLPALLSSLVKMSSESPLNAETWLAADYSPLPSLVSAARIIFQHEPLPNIRRAQSAGVANTIAELVAIGKQAQKSGELHLALVTGVPGAGKTLVGLQFVYENHFDDTESKRTAVFLSGNGPLVKVLQHALKSSIFVQDVHGFLKQYGGRQKRLPEEQIWVYDEAQRAWDAARVQEKRGHGISEPQDFLSLGGRMDSWALMVGLIGEGQEIHIGEEGGLEQWNTAIQATHQSWIVHCPQKIAHIFTAAANVYTSDRLDLTASLRFHLAEDVQLWISQLLHGRLAHAAKTAQSVYTQGFDMYITQDIELAKQYVRERYQGQEEKRYGLLASSKAKNLIRYGIHNDFNYTRNLREGPWYNDPPQSPLSSCQLKDVATEFACQGLELDFPLIGWGNDLIWDNTAWKSPTPLRSQAHNPHQLRINSYRVLLSRGRDGFIIFVPKEMNMETTYEAIVEAGLRKL